MHPFMIPDTPLVPHGRALFSEPGQGLDSWQLLDDFLRQLQEQQSSSLQLQAMLETVLRMTHADLVFACSLLEQGSVSHAGELTQSSAWCREVARKLLMRAGEADAHLFPAGQIAQWTDPSPQCAALVRLSKSRRIWLVAVVLTTDRSLRKGDLQMMRLARRMLMQQHRQMQTFGQLKDALISLVRCLTAALDARDPFTWGHSERVARMSARLAQELKIPEKEIHDIYLSGLLHDIGKIGVRDDILRKPGPLTPEERTQIERHPVIGDVILSHVSQLAHLRPAVRGHHEHYNGQGYPDRLAGEAIPLHARLMAVADSCDAMLSDRPYRKGMEKARINKILAEGSGTQWDPDIIAALFRIQEEVFAIHARGIGDSVMRAIEEMVQGSRMGVLSPPSTAEFKLGIPDD
jgi:hypothetical protein